MIITAIVITLINISIQSIKIIFYTSYYEYFTSATVPEAATAACVLRAQIVYDGDGNNTIIRLLLLDAALKGRQ